MRERPILFSAPMVRAILAGRKTQTRRVVKPQPDTIHDGEPYWNIGGYRAWQHRPPGNVLRQGTQNPLRCPYGAPGDRLWVRETWRIPEGAPDGWVDYRADDARGGFLWRPSIFMPRKFSRIGLEVVEVRVQPLQDITEADAMAEGIRYFGDLPSTHPYGQDARWSWQEAPRSTEECLGSARYAFGNLWDSINAAGAWDSNPWVWVVQFRRLP